MIKYLSKNKGLCLLLTLAFCLSSSLPTVLFAAAATTDTVTQVICNIILTVQGWGLPIMTGVILGSSIMAIFGRLAWPAIVMLVVFTAVFFGATQIISKFAGSATDTKDFKCEKDTP